MGDLILFPKNILPKRGDLEGISDYTSIGSSSLTKEQSTLLKTNPIARSILSILQNSKKEDKSYSLSYLHRELKVRSRNSKFVIRGYNLERLYSSSNQLTLNYFVELYKPERDARRYLAKRVDRLRLKREFYLDGNPGEEANRLIRSYVLHV